MFSEITILNLVQRKLVSFVSVAYEWGMEVKLVDMCCLSVYQEHYLEFVVCVGKSFVIDFTF